MRILLVEDEKEVARSISRELGRSGFVADCVSSIDGARRALDGEFPIRWSFWIGGCPTATAFR